DVNEIADREPVGEVVFRVAAEGHRAAADIDGDGGLRQLGDGADDVAAGVVAVVAGLVAALVVVSAAGLVVVAAAGLAAVAAGEGHGDRGVAVLDRLGDQDDRAGSERIDVQAGVDVQRRRGQCAPPVPLRVDALADGGDLV